MNPLAGKRIVVTRPRSQAGDLLEKLQAAGAVPIALPVIEAQPLADPTRLDQAIAELESYNWVIFTSANGVQAFWARLEACGRSAAAFSGLHVAAIGPATARALANRGVAPNFVPDEFIAEAIAAGIGNVLGQRILLPRADIARKALAEELARRGAARIDEIAAYHTVGLRPDAAVLAELRQGFNAITFTSASTVGAFVQLLAGQNLALPPRTVVACIGPITAAAALDSGLAVQVVATEYTGDGLLRALVNYFEQNEREKLQ